MSVLITGASGAICQSLTKKLREKGIIIHLLSANLNKKSKQNNIYYWNARTKEIDHEAFEGVDHIVHLAGAGIADTKWTKERKYELEWSRTETAELLFNTLKTLNKPIKKYISAGAIGIFEEGIIDANEGSKQGTDFMAELCKKWEDTLKLFHSLYIPTTLFRTGIVLDKDSGFYGQMAQLAKYYAAAVPGSGKQWVSWIHMQDMVNMYYDAIMDETITGTYNATAPNPVSLKEIIKGICENENRKLILPNIPPFVIKIIFGEMAQVILSSKKVLPAKWLAENRTFAYPFLSDALKAI